MSFSKGKGTTKKTYVLSDPWARTQRQEKRIFLRAKNETKEERRRRELVELIQEAWYERKGIPELKRVRLDVDVDVQGNMNPTKLEPNRDYEFVAFVELVSEPGFSFSSFTPDGINADKVLVRISEWTSVEVPRFLLRPAPLTDEDIQLYIMKRQIGI